ncbi:MAG: hypothetical protein K8H86_00580 [Ignavibacteriaceae bacterium]|nr:hypothetical protein [Ignavibacteriaceae bacterium]
MGSKSVFIFGRPIHKTGKMRTDAVSFSQLNNITSRVGCAGLATRHIIFV